MGEGVTGWVLANRKAFANTDPKLDLPSSLAARFREYRTLAAFPVLRDKQRFGVVTLYSSRLTVYTTDQQRLLEEAAALLGAALSSSGEAALLEMQQAPGEMAVAPLTVSVVESELKH